MDVDVVEEKLTTTAFLALVWTDENLQWDPDLYGGVSKLLIPQSLVWTPDMALDNGFTKMKALGDNFVLVNARDDGTVLWEPYEVFETKCAMNIEYFPFDKQTCDINVGVWTSEYYEVAVRLNEEEMDFDYFQENSEWDLVGHSAISYTTTSNQANIKVSIVMERKAQYYMYNVVAPILMLSILAIFTFAIPVESGEKLGFCMTVYLAFAVFLTIISASLPVSSVMSLLGKYLLFLLIIGTLIVIICTLELRVHFRHSSREIPGWVQRLVRLSLVLQCRRNCRRQKVTNMPEKEIGDEHVPKEDPINITWMDVSASIDFYCFWISLVAVMIGTLVLFQKGYNKDHAGH